MEVIKSLAIEQISGINLGAS